MTQVAVLGRPRDLPVMASTAEFTVGNFLHGHIIRPGLHLEAQFTMTNPALVTNTMKPVRKYNRPHALRIRTFVQYDIGVFSQDR